MYDDDGWGEQEPTYNYRVDRWDPAELSKVVPDLVAQAAAPSGPMG